MKKLALRVAAAAVALPGIALASGDSGTGAVADMQIGGKQLVMILGAFVAFGFVIWLVAKFTMGGGSAKK